MLPKRNGKIRGFAFSSRILQQLATESNESKVLQSSQTNQKLGALISEQKRFSTPFSVKVFVFRFEAFQLIPRGFLYFYR